jgi:integrase
MRLLEPRLSAHSVAALGAAFAAELGDLLCPQSHDGVVWRRVRYAARKAGIRGAVFPHRFSHTFAVAFCDAGGGIDLLQTILRHSSLEMSIFYSRANREKRALESQARLNPADLIFGKAS